MAIDSTIAGLAVSAAVGAAAWFGKAILQWMAAKAGERERSTAALSAKEQRLDAASSALVDDLREELARLAERLEREEQTSERLRAERDEAREAGVRARLDAAFQVAQMREIVARRIRERDDAREEVSQLRERREIEARTAEVLRLPSGEEQP